MVDSLDTPYDPAQVSPANRPVFDQLQKELGGQFEIWVRRDDVGRFITAGILNKQKSIAVTVRVESGGRQIRTELTALEIDRIRDHLTSDATSDLEL